MRSPTQLIFVVAFQLFLIAGCATLSSESGQSTRSDSARASSASQDSGDLGNSAQPLPPVEPQTIDQFLAEPYSERWYGNATMYEIMVRSFADSDGDGVGDLQGLISKLDYLNTGDPSTTSDLKIDAIWLMPIFKSPSYHGYDAIDYYEIDPVYGTLEDFKMLVREAHRRNIRVLLDLVLNHTSYLHPWFQKSGKGPDSPMRDWYIWRTDQPDWHQPWGPAPTWHQRGDWYYYGLFWEGMPDLNYNDPEVGDEMIKIGKYWLQQGADGYRLDAIRYLYEEGKDRQADLPATHAYLKRFAKEMRTVKVDTALVGEVWSETRDVAPYYGNGDELDLAFGFEESGGIKATVASGDPGALIDSLQKVGAAYAERRFSAPFLSNHDMSRIASDFGSDMARLRLAASLLMSLPGTPFLYQGEEIGLTNGPRAGDEGKRTPMQWDTGPSAGFTTAAYPWNPLSGKQDKRSVEAQLGDPQSLLSHYQKLIRQRHASSALRVGSISGVARGTEKRASFLTFQRAAPNEIVVCLFNVGDTKLPEGSVTLAPEALKDSELDPSGLKAENLSDGTPAGITGTSVKVPAMKGRTALWIRVFGA